MRLFLSASLAVIAFVATMAVDTKDANAVVCAAGVYRAGCAAVGPHGAAAVGVRGAAVVGVRAVQRSYVVPSEDGQSWFAEHAEDSLGHRSARGGAYAIAASAEPSARSPCPAGRPQAALRRCFARDLVVDNGSGLIALPTAASLRDRSQCGKVSYAARGYYRSARAVSGLGLCGQQLFTMSISGLTQPGIRGANVRWSMAG